jgi:hypothetical protein
MSDQSLFSWNTRLRVDIADVFLTVDQRLITFASQIFKKVEFVNYLPHSAQNVRIAYDIPQQEISKPIWKIAIELAQRHQFGLFPHVAITILRDRANKLDTRIGRHSLETRKAQKPPG